jgi:hypothetical protein
VNLNTLAAAVTGMVSPLTPIVITPEVGYTTAPDGTLTPNPSAQVQTSGQVQALSQSDLKQIEGLNLQGEMASVYLPGEWSGVIRVTQQGGTTLAFNNQTWLVVSVPEQWPNWTRVIACLQR